MKKTGNTINNVFHFVPEKTQGNGLFSSEFRYEDFAFHGVKMIFSATYIMELSVKNTLRGLFIQEAPLVQNLLVKCTKGRAKILLLDMRDGSNSYLEKSVVEISCEDGDFLYIGAGVAHGVISLEADTSLFFMADNIVSAQNQILISAFDGRFEDVIPEGVVASVVDRMAPRAEEIKNNFW